MRLNPVSLELGQGVSLVARISPEIRGLGSWVDRLDYSRGEGQGFAAPGGRFSQALLLAIEHGLLPEISQRMRGQILIELGAGCHAHGFRIARATHARAYLGVEPYYGDVLERAITSEADSQQLPYAVLCRDMRSQLEALPDRSVSVIACGIEDCILPSRSYRRSVERELTRVLHEDGVMVSSQSDLFPKGLRQQSRNIRRPGTRVTDRVVWYRR